MDPYHSYTCWAGSSAGSDDGSFVGVSRAVVLANHVLKPGAPEFLWEARQQFHRGGRQNGWLNGSRGVVGCRSSQGI